MKKRTVLMAIALGMLALTGCKNSSTVSNSGTEEKTVKTQESQDDITIIFWHSMGGVNGQAVDYLVEKFNTENTLGIYVDSQYQGNYDDAINKLRSAQIGNMGADLVQIYDIGTRFMIDSGWVIPMQELVDADGWDLNEIEPNLAAYYSIDNTLYSMPFNSSTPIMYYNKDMFAKAGITEAPASLEELERIGRELMDKGEAGEAISLAIYGWFFEELTCKQGLPYVDNGNGRTAPATQVAFVENGGGERILAAWKDLHDAGIAPNIGRGGDAGNADFGAGKAAITLASTASLKQILLEVDGKFEVGTAYFPKVNDADDGGVSIGGGSLWALNNEDEARKAATWEFIKFLISPESQAHWSVETGYFPVTIAAQEEPAFKANIEAYPQFVTALDQLHDSSPQSAGALLSVFPEARQIVEAEIENMLNNDVSPADTVSKIADSINKAIEEYNLLNN